jgi:hypothetical protein
MENLKHTSKVKIGKLNKYIFFVEKLNISKSFAFTSSNFIIDHNIRLLQSSKSQSVLAIDFNTLNKVHFLNFGKYIIVFRCGKDNLDREMYFIDYQLKERSILLMDEIFHQRELEVILTLRKKMIETYEGKEKLIASIASIYN